MKYIKHPFLRYLAIGGLNTGTNYLLFLLMLIILPYQVAYTLAYLAGIVTSYLLNSWLVFKEPLSWRKAVQYPIVYVVQFIIGFMTLSLFIEALGISPQIAGILNVLVAIPVTFTLSKFIIKGGTQSTRGADA